MRLQDVVRLGLAVAASWVGTTFQAEAQVLLEEVRTLSNAAPSIERSFDPTPAGAYEIRLTDNAFPAAFVSLKLIVTRGSQIVATVNAPGANAVPFNATAGAHVIHILGEPNVTARAGTFAVDLRPTGSATPTLQFADAINLPPATPPNANQLVLQTKFTVNEAGAYQVVLSDLAFPSALTSLLLNIVGPGGSSVFAVSPPGAGTYPFTAVAGDYDLFVIAEAPASAAAGLLGVTISGGASNGAVYDQAHAVGSLGAPASMTLGPGNAHTLRTTDFNFPAALSRLSAIVMRGGTSLARRDTPGTAGFNASGGAAQVFVLAAPASGGSGTYGVEVLNAGGTAVYQDVSAANPPAGGGTPGFTYSVDVTAAGSYRVVLADFQFPAALQTLALNVSQAGNSLGTLSAAGPLDVNAASGRLFVSAIAQLPNPSTSSLFGLQATPAAGGTPILDVTQGVGELFTARTINVTTAGRYDVTLTDLNFPNAFADLALAVTRGSSRVGSIFGGGTFAFDATPGSYFVNFVAIPNATQKAGTYGLRVTPTPPAPTVTLSATPASVTNGSTTNLTWNSTNATACTASGAWSGSKATSGSQPSAALTSSSTFTLTCNGAGGSANQSVTVTIAPPASGGDGGGGSLGVLSLWALLTVFATRRMERRYA